MALGIGLSVNQCRNYLVGDDDVQALTDAQLGLHLTNIENLMEIYGPFDASRANFIANMKWGAYLGVQALVQRDTNAKIVASPFRSESIGSYRYDKGRSADERPKPVIQDHPTIWSIVQHYMKSARNATKIMSVIFPEPLPDSMTGEREFIDEYEEQMQHLNERGIESGSLTFRRVKHDNR